MSRRAATRRPHRFHWNWQDIQQLELSDGKLVRVVSYHDRVALAGQDQPFTFLLDGRVDLTPVYRELREKLDQRLVARLADAAGAPLWTLAVKRLGAVRGSEGTLLVLAEGIVYKTETPWQSRTWRDSDIDNISTSGPFELSVTTLERNGVFHFQLKQTPPPRALRGPVAPLEPAQGARPDFYDQGEHSMKTPIGWALACGLALAQGPAKTYTGVITDTMCGANHVHMGVKPEAKCVRECVKGGQYKYAPAGGRQDVHAQRPADTRALRRRESEGERDAV